MEKSQMPAEHERLFDEICNKLNELSQKSGVGASDPIEKMQFQLKKSQDELSLAQAEIEQKIHALDNLSVIHQESPHDSTRLAEQLDLERQQNSKLTSDLSKSLELNLKLQFEIEEIKTKSHSQIVEERKHNSYLTDKNKGLSQELELNQALVADIKSELQKAKEKFNSEQIEWQSNKYHLSETLAAKVKKSEELQAEIDLLSTEMKSLGDNYTSEIEKKNNEISELSQAMTQYQDQAQSQGELLKNLSAVAEKKIIELKMALDRKSLEAQDYYSNLQQALTQIQIIKQENLALRDYINKIATLHQQNIQQDPSLNSLINS